MRDLVGRVVDQVRRDHLKSFAGNLAYRGLFAIFAVLVLVFSLLRVFDAVHLVEVFLDQLSPAIPESMMDALRDQILATTREASPEAFGLAAAASFVAALYGLSATARGVIDALNVMYEVQERRPFLKRYVASILLALVIILLLLAAVLLVVLGPAVERVASVVGLDPIFRILWDIARWPLLLALVLLAFAITYFSAPAVKLPFRWVSHGSIVALALWAVFTFGFALYVDSFGSFGATYGTLAGVIVLLLYMFFASFILLLGAEVNDVVHRHQQAANKRAPGGETTG